MISTNEKVYSLSSYALSTGLPAKERNWEGGEGRKGEREGRGVDEEDT